MIKTQQPDEFRAWLLLGGIMKPERAKKYLLKAQMMAPEKLQIPKDLQCEIAQSSQQIVKDTGEAQIESSPTVSDTEGNQQITSEKRDFPWLKTSVLVIVFLVLAIKFAKWVDSQSSQPKADDSGEPQVDSTPVVNSEAVDRQITPGSRDYSWLKTSALVFVLVVLAFLFGIGLTSFLRGTEPTILGHQLIIVISGSMEPVFNTGSIILINTKNSENFSKGDIVMFRLPEIPLTNVTHRIIEVVDDENGTVYQTKGDNNDYEDNLMITDVDIVGQYTHITIPGAGYFFSFVKSRNGLILLAMSFGIFLIISQVVRIKELLSANEET